MAITDASEKDMAAPKLSVKELARLLSAEFPEMFHATSGFALEAAWQGGCRVRKAFDSQSLRRSDRHSARSWGFSDAPAPSRKM